MEPHHVKPPHLDSCLSGQRIAGESGGGGRRGEEKVGRGGGGLKDVPEREADTNSLLPFPAGSFVSGREPATKTEAV